MVNDFHGSDHKPLCITLAVAAVAPPPPPAPALSWSFHQQEAYSAYIADHDDVLSGILDLLESGDADCVTRAAMMLDVLVRQAAGATNMLRVRKHGGRPRALPLGPEAVAVRDEIRAQRKVGLPVPPALRKQWRQYVRDARLEHASQRHTRIKRSVAHSKPPHFLVLASWP